MFKSSMRWMTSMISGGLVKFPPSMLDNSPLRSLLSRNVRFPRIQTALDSGWLEAIAITAAGYASARSTSFFQAASNQAPWFRTRRLGLRTKLNLDHVMGSIAVPMMFPPVRIRGEYYGDGAMRQATPLSPAIHLGADRILVIGIRNEMAGRSPDLRHPQEYPSFAQIAGYTLDALFMDGMYSDLERMTRINQMLDEVPDEMETGVLAEMRAIDTMVIVPSDDLREVAYTYRKELPIAVRTLFRGLGGGRSTEGRLLSYLLFEAEYTRALIDLGYKNALSVKDELLAFINGDPVPRLFAPSWVQHDLVTVHGDLRDIVNQAIP
jgi:NTE family protein